MKIARCVQATRKSPGLARSSVVGRQSRGRLRPQKERVRDRALLGCSSLPESEWDYANGYQQNQTKVPRKMRSDQGVKTVRAPRSLTWERSDKSGITQPQNLNRQYPSQNFGKQLHVI